MEGVASEAASLAGHLKLGKLIYLYDNNHISLAASTDLTFTEDWRSGSRLMAGTRKQSRMAMTSKRSTARCALRAPKPRDVVILARHPHRLRIAGQAGYVRSARSAAGRGGSEADEAKARLAG